MKWTSKDRLFVEGHMKALSTNYSRIYVLIPTATGTSNYDEMEDSPLDITNTSTSASGQTLTWAAYEIYARLGGPTFTDLITADGNGLEKGDIALFIKPTDYDLMQSVITNNRAYLYINKDTYRPFGTQNTAGVFNGNEYKVECKHYTPIVFATGFGS